MIIYDKNSKKSFDEVEIHFSELTSQVYQDMPIMLVGNKTDSIDELESIDYETGFKKACELGLLYVETSARTGFNVDFAFYNLARSAFVRNFCTRKQLTYRFTQIKI